MLKSCPKCGAKKLSICHLIVWEVRQTKVFFYFDNTNKIKYLDFAKIYWDLDFVLQWSDEITLEISRMHMVIM